MTQNVSIGGACPKVAVSQAFACYCFLPTSHNTDIATINGEQHEQKDGEQHEQKEQRGQQEQQEEESVYDHKKNQYKKSEEQR